MNWNWTLISNKPVANQTPTSLPTTRSPITKESSPEKEFGDWCGLFWSQALASLMWLGSYTNYRLIRFLVGGRSFISSSGWVPTCDSAHSWRLYGAAPLGDQAVSTITWYPIQSQYPDTEPTSPCPILVKPDAWLRSNKYKLLSHWFDSTMVWIHWFESHDLPKPKTNKPTTYNDIGVFAYLSLTHLAILPGSIWF